MRRILRTIRDLLPGTPCIPRHCLTCTRPVTRLNSTQATAIRRGHVAHCRRCGGHLSDPTELGRRAWAELGHYLSEAEGEVSW